MPAPKHIRTIFASLFVLTPLSYPSVTYAQMDAPLTMPVDASDTLLSRLETSVSRFIDLYDKHGNKFNKFKEALEGAETTYKVLAGDTMVVDQQILDDIKKDTEILKGFRSVTPEFVLFTEKEYSELDASNQAEVREFYQKLEKRYGDYEKLYERWQKKRDQAARISEDAHAAWARADQLTEKLEGVLNDPVNAAPIMYYYRLDQLWFDVAFPLNEAVAKRAHEADRLKLEYDRSLEEMKLHLDRWEPAMQSIQLFKVQDGLINQVPIPDMNKSDLEKLLEQETPGMDQIQKGLDMAEQSKDIPVRSPEAMTIEQLLDEANVSNEMVRQKAIKLYAQADAQDAEAVKSARTLAALQLGLQVAQTLASMPEIRNAPVKEKGFDYKYRSYERTINLDGSTSYRFFQISIEQASPASLPKTRIFQEQGTQTPLVLK